MLISNMPIMMLKALLLTIVVELLGAFILGVRVKKDLLNVLLVNVITNPIVNGVTITLDLLYGVTARNISLIILELLVFAGEGLLYKKTLEYKKINPFILSIILNGLSYSIGLILL